MSRLTRKSEHNINGYVYLEKQELIGENPALMKLGKLEDLEEELGCPLDVVFKALNNGIYTHWNWNCDFYDETEELSYIENVYFGKNPFDDISLMFGYKKESTIDLKDYKKTWWLKEDKSE